MTRSVLRLFALALAGSVALPALAADRALIVGINSYPDLTSNGLGHQYDLYGAVNDARTMAGAVTAAFGIPPENVTVLTDEAATRAGILEAFQRELVDGTSQGDRVVFYYAGHGAQVSDPSGDEDDALDEVLVPHDARAEMAAAAPVLDGVIRDDEIEALLQGLAGRDVTIIVDACHSGTITRSALSARTRPLASAYRPVRTITPNGPLTLAPRLSDVEARLDHRRKTTFVNPDLTRMPAGGPKLAVWTAVNSAQYALEDMSIGGSAGLFTSRFVRGLAEFAADTDNNGVVTPAELLVYLREETDRYCASFDCLGQDPMPMLEAWEGYEQLALATRDSASGPAVARLEATDAGESIVRTPELLPAVPAEMLPSAEDAGVSVTVAGGGRMRVGEALSLTVTSSVGGRLVVLDRRGDGTVVQLYPNRPALDFGASPLIAPGQTVTIPPEDGPYELLADAAGRGTLAVLVVDPAVDLGDLLAENGDLEPVATPAGYAGRLSSAVNRAIVFPGGEGEAGEAALEARPLAPRVIRADVVYEIVP